MANTDVTQRTQFERVDLSVPTTGVRVRSKKALIIYVVIAALVLVALGYATVQALDGWARFVVLAGIIVTAIGAMIAINPQRRG